MTNYNLGNTNYSYLCATGQKRSLVFEGGWRGENKKSELKAVNVIQDIRDEFHIVGGEAAVAGGEAAVADDDPMLGLDDVVETKAAPTSKSIDRNKHTKRSDVRELTMPMRPLCAAPEANETKIITVYRKAAASEAAIRNNTALYLRTDCLIRLVVVVCCRRALLPRRRTHYRDCSAVADWQLPRSQ